MVTPRGDAERSSRKKGRPGDSSDDDEAPEQVDIAIYHDDEANTHAGLRNRKWPAGTEVSLVIETRSLHFHSNTNTNGVQPVARGAAEASWRDLPVIKRGSVAWGDGDPAALFGGRLEGGPWLVGTLRGIVDYVPLFRGAPCDNAASPAKRQGSFRRRLGGA